MIFFAGTAGDSLTSRGKGDPFTTKDRDHDSYYVNCAVKFTGAWWYSACHFANLNGLYGSSEQGKGINWYTWKGYHYSAKKAEMKIRPTD